MIHLNKPMSILLVEDNVLNQKLMYFNLTKMGFTLTTVDNGQKAVDICQDNYFDFILMDLMMPVMDGYQATIAIRELEKSRDNKTFIIGLSANVYDSDREKCIEVGMDEFLSKPLDIDRFVDILTERNFI